MNKARIGVIGAGWWATEYHIPNLKKREDVELISVCKLEEDQLNFVKDKFNFKKMTDKYEEKNYELNIKRNLANSISQKLILRLAVN